MRIRLKNVSAWRRTLAPSDRRWWLLTAVGLRIEISREPVWDFVVYWKRLLVVLAALAVAGYAVGVTALHRWWARQPETQLAWTDIAMAPLHWEKFRQQRGERMIAVGQRQLADGNFAAAAFTLQTGLARAPEHLAGRLALVQVWRAVDHGRALKLAEDGLQGSPGQPELLRALFELYASFGATSLTLARSAELLAPEHKPVLPVATRRIVANARAACLLAQPDAAAALAVLGALPRDFATVDGLRSVKLSLVALRKLGRNAEAKALMAEVPPDAARDPWIEAELAQASGDETALDTALRRLKAKASDPVPALLYAFRAWHELNRATLRQAVADEFLRFHDGDERALQRFGALAMELDLPHVLLQAEQVAARRRFNPFAFQVHQTELALRRGELEDARRRLAKWETTLPELSNDQRVIPELFARLIRAAGPSSETQGTALLTHISRCGPQLSPGLFALAITTLERGGNLVGAAQVAELAERYLPQCDELRAQRVRLVERVEQQKIADARMGSAPPTPTPAAAREEPSALMFESGAAALAAIDDSLALRDPDRAIRAIQAVHRAAPAWLDEVAPALAMREFRARWAQEERPAAMLVFRSLAVKSGVPRGAAFRLVRELIAEGQHELALDLAREIVRLLPGEKAATVLLQEAETAATPEDEKG